MLEFADGRTLYHTGDTWLFGEMSLIQERYHPSIILLGVGGGPYTLDAATAFAGDKQLNVLKAGELRKF